LSENTIVNPVRRLIMPGLLVVVAVIVAVVFGSDDPGHGWDKRQHVVTVRLAYFPNLTHAAALVGVSKGFWWRAMGENRLETKVVNAGPEAMEALSAGAIDFAYVGPSPAINTYLKSNGRALRVIGGACEGGASLVARKGSNISGLVDLQGKRLAVPQLGGTQDVSARFFLSHVGLKPREIGGTVQVLPVKNGDMLGLMKTGQIDAGWVPEPWASRCVVELGALRVVDERDLWPGGFPTTVLVVRAAFAEQHPELVKAAISANNQALASIASDSATAKRTVNAELARLTGKPLSQEVLEMAWGEMKFKGDVSINSLERQAEAAVQAGYLPSDHASLQGITP
jgi:NitT/TauT family transport system substrate-binding protein